MFDKTELLALGELPISNPSDEKTSIESHEKRNKRKRHRWKLVTLANSAKGDLFEFLVFTMFLILGVGGIAIVFAGLMAISG